MLLEKGVNELSLSHRQQRNTRTHARRMLLCSSRRNAESDLNRIPGILAAVLGALTLFPHAVLFRQRHLKLPVVDKQNIRFITLSGGRTI